MKKLKNRMLDMHPAIGLPLLGSLYVIPALFIVFISIYFGNLYPKVLGAGFLIATIYSLLMFTGHMFSPLSGRRFE